MKYFYLNLIIFLQIRWSVFLLSRNQKKMLNTLQIAEFIPGQD
jgi:hypothetical protein